MSTNFYSSEKPKNELELARDRLEKFVYLKGQIFRILNSVASKGRFNESLIAKDDLDRIFKSRDLIKGVSWDYMVEQLKPEIEDKYLELKESDKEADAVNFASAWEYVSDKVFSRRQSIERMQTEKEEKGIDNLGVLANYLANEIILNGAGVIDSPSFKKVIQDTVEKEGFRGLPAAMMDKLMAKLEKDIDAKSISPTKKDQYKSDARKKIEDILNKLN